MQDFLAFAHALADAAGDAIRPYFNAHGTVETKDDASPVTIADKAAEAAMRALITARFPEHGIFGEEFGQMGGVYDNISASQLPAPSSYIWVIDPIDGTRAFIAGGTEWGTLIALCDNGVPILGVLDQPITGERWVGAQGMATQYSSLRGGHANAAIKTRPCHALSAASISTTSARYFTPPQAARFVALAAQCSEVIENGDCYAYGLLARGQRDVVVDAGLKPYDILALVPIIEGAGGCITSWDGAAVTLSNYTNVVAVSDRTLHAEALNILAHASA